MKDCKERSCASLYCTKGVDVGAFPAEMVPVHLCAKSGPAEVRASFQRKDTADNRRLARITEQKIMPGKEEEGKWEGRCRQIVGVRVAETDEGRNEALVPGGF